MQVSSKLPLRYARTQLGMTQRQLGGLARVNEVTVLRAEKGETISLLTAHAILNALNAIRAERNLAPLGLSDVDWTVQGE